MCFSKTPKHNDGYDGHHLQQEEVRKSEQNFFLRDSQQETKKRNEVYDVTKRKCNRRRKKKVAITLKTWDQKVWKLSGWGNWNEVLDKSQQNQSKKGAVSITGTELNPINSGQDFLPFANTSKLNYRIEVHFISVDCECRLTSSMFEESRIRKSFDETLLHR
jgi:hypothetical protein